jgi:demethylmenaquinone methyltransferase/2-methoxy-6-polyprenyl-1,4-benzoquinol methylase
VNRRKGHASDTRSSDILSVSRTKKDAKQFYDRISRFYDCAAGVFERPYSEIARKRLAVAEDETVLEIGSGSGYCLRRMVESAGPTGRVYGADISTGMLRVTRSRLAKAGLCHRAGLYCGDAAKLPHGEAAFDAVLISFTLELFDTPEIPVVLQEVKRVLRPQGRLAVVSMSKEGGQSAAVRLYEYVHKRWPSIDCRPIYAEQALKDAGYGVTSRERLKMFGLPVEIVVGVN